MRGGGVSKICVMRKQVTVADTSHRPLWAGFDGALHAQIRKKGRSRYLPRAL
jgi:hypothetical protein